MTIAVTLVVLAITVAAVVGAIVAGTRVRAGLEHEVERTRDLTSILLHRPSPTVPSFVSLLIYGRDADDKPMFCGTSARLCLVGTQVTLKMTAQMPFAYATAVVLCDASRVDITGIFLGVDLAQAGHGDCPMAILGKWEVGVTVRAVVTLRPG